MLFRTQITPTQSWRNGHLQTLHPQYQSPQKPQTKKFRLSLGDTQTVAYQAGQLDGDVILLYHGLEGTIESAYVRRLIAEANARGIGVLMPQLRGTLASETTCGTYHSWSIADFQHHTDYLLAAGAKRITAVGYSLGAAMLLNYLAIYKPNDIDQAIAVCPPFRFEDSIETFSKGMGKVYGNYLLRKLNQAIARINHIRGETPATKMSSVYEFDDRITALNAGYANARAYYRDISPVQRFGKITTHTHIITAADDPFFKTSSIPNQSKLGVNMRLEYVPNGGHCGFVEGYQRFWLEPRVVDLALDWGS